MARLPIPGSDTNTWGEILNDYLSQSLGGDGTLRNGVVSNDNVSGGAAIAAAKIAGTALTASSNLSDVGSAATSRTNLGLSNASTRSVGTGADQVLSADAIDAKGDLFVGTANDTLNRFPVGADGTFIVADSTRSQGMKWRTGIVFDVRNYGAIGDGVADDAAAIQAAINAAKDAGVIIRPSGDSYINHDHRGTVVYLPPGKYLINSPIILPRSGTYRANTVGLVGIGLTAASTMIHAGPLFPSGRALIEWENDGVHGNVRDQIIANLTLSPKLAAGSRAIHLGLIKARSDYGLDVNSIDTMYNCRFENLIFFGYNQYNPSSIRLEGRVDFCVFRNLTADYAQGSPITYSTRLLEVDDLSLWPALDVLPYMQSGDAPGANSCIIEEIWSGFRGGFATILYGRVNGSRVGTFFAQGAAGTASTVHIKGGGFITGTQWGSEGQAEDGIFRFENCHHINISQISLGVTELATSGSPGAGIKLINVRQSSFVGRPCIDGTPAHSDHNSVLVSADENCRDIRIQQFQSTAPFEDEIYIHPNATNIVIDYEDVSTGSRALWSPRQTVAGHLMPPGYYVMPEGSRTTAAMVSGVEWAVPIRIARDCTIDRIACEVTTPGTAGTVIRLGIRDSTAYGLPGALISDAGTVAGSANGNFEITVSVRLRKPGKYWLTAVAQSTGVTLPTIRVVSNNIEAASPSLAGAMSATACTGYSSNTGITGALPNTYTVTTRLGLGPLIAIRTP
jgi:hypothetical protein